MAFFDKHGDRICNILVGAAASICGAPSYIATLAVLASDLAWLGRSILKDDQTGLKAKITSALNDTVNAKDQPVLAALFDDSKKHLTIDLSTVLERIRRGNAPELAPIIAQELCRQLRFDGHSDAQRTAAERAVTSAVKCIVDTERFKDNFVQGALIDLIKTNAAQSETLKSLLDELRLQRADGVVLHRKMAEEVGDVFVDLTFSARKTDFTGRVEEKGRIADFLKEEQTLLWWQVAGPGGEGKSRFALDIVDTLGGEWYGGFLSSDHLLQTDWARVAFSEPTLIVIDYLAAPQKAEAFARMMTALRARDRGDLGGGVRPLGHPVRVLVLEREACDLNEVPRDRALQNWLSGALSNPETKAVLLATFFDQEMKTALTLGPMSGEELIRIANSWRRHRGRAMLQPHEADALIAALGPHPEKTGRSRAWRPLFAMIFAEMAGSAPAAGAGGQPVAIEDLLRAVLEQERRDFWRKDTVTMGAAHLAILATIAGAVDLEGIAERLSPNRMDEGSETVAQFYGLAEKETVERAWALLGRAVRPNRQQGMPRLHARSPDLLGEYLVLWLLRETRNDFDAEAEQSRCAALINDACLIDMGGLFEFLGRANRDFPANETLTALRAAKPTEAVARLSKWLPFNAVSFVGLAGFLEQNLNGGQSIPEKGHGLADALTAAAQEGHVEIVRALIDAGAEVNRVNTESGTFPLLMAA